MNHLFCFATMSFVTMSFVKGIDMMLQEVKRGASVIKLPPGYPKFWRNLDN